MSNKATWYKLIYHWCQKRKPKGYGLTIPFIIGAEEKMTISQLLKAIKDSEYEYKIILRWCNDLNEYVLSIPDKYINQYVDRMKGDKSLLYDEEELTSRSFDEVVKFMETNYNEIIDSETYSKNKKTGKWGEFTKVDNEFINQASES